MKIKIAVYSLIFLSTFWIGLPYVFIATNDYLNLLTINNAFLKIFGGIVIVLGLSGFLNSVFVFNKDGKGTPVPINPPKKLVLKGLFKYSRNPLYVCHLIILLGEFFIFGRVLLLVYLGLMGIAFHLYIVKLEEPELRIKFGKSYLNYLKKVPRWF